MIFPSIDLMNGNVVQLIQGKAENKQVELNNPLEIAKKFSKYTISVIDLDAAMGKGSNLGIIKEICKIAKCRVGGGIRTLEKIQEVLDAGAEKVILGTCIFKDNELDMKFLKELFFKKLKDKIIIALDSKAGEVVIEGWQKPTGLKVLDLVPKLENYCSEYLCTYVDKEGMMQGTNIDFFKKIKSLTQNEVTAAGGISSNNEIKQLEEIGVNSVLGMALYTGTIKLDDLEI